MDNAEVDARMEYKKIFENNKQFIKNTIETDPLYF